MSFYFQKVEACVWMHVGDGGKIWGKSTSKQQGSSHSYARSICTWGAQQPTRLLSPTRSHQSLGACGPAPSFVRFSSAPGPRALVSGAHHTFLSQQRKGGRTWEEQGRSEWKSDVIQTTRTFTEGRNIDRCLTGQPQGQMQRWRRAQQQLQTLAPCIIRCAPNSP